MAEEVALRPAVVAAPQEAVPVAEEEPALSAAMAQEESLREAEPHSSSACCQVASVQPVLARPALESGSVVHRMLFFLAVRLLSHPGATNMLKLKALRR